MDLNDKKENPGRLFRSFQNAFRGLVYVIKKERNMQIHLCMSIFVILLSLIFSISKFEFIIILFLIGFVLCLETINTAIERAVDLVTTEYQPLAKISKDVAAAAVLIASLISIIIGGIIFYEPFLQCLLKIIGQ